MMRRPTTLAAAFAVVGLAACQARPSAAPAEDHASAVPWAYEGAGNPESWGDLSPAYAACAAGREQSPIDLPEGAPEGAPPLTIHENAVPLSLTDNGHTIEFESPDGGGIEIGGRQYALRQFHVHTPSEHTLAGVSFPMEMHFVHADSSDSLAVVGVLFTQGAENPALARVMPLVRGLVPGQRVDLPSGIDVNELIPEGGYLGYRGSLTTPPCKEGVRWLVMETPVEASAEQLATFATALGHSNRPVQPLGDRTVVRGAR